MIQSRLSDGPLDEFNRTWAEYEAGFGSCSSNYWLGLKTIAALTAGKDQELRIELEDWYGDKRFARYDNFSISGASDFYRLFVGGFSGGDAGNCLETFDLGSNNAHHYMKFSTPDKDNDTTDENNWASFWSSGWWFNYCFYSNLNGLYKKDEIGFSWGSWIDWTRAIKKSEMKIRDKK